MGFSIQNSFDVFFNITFLKHWNIVFIFITLVNLFVISSMFSLTENHEFKQNALTDNLVEVVQVLQNDNKCVLFSTFSYCGWAPKWVSCSATSAFDNHDECQLSFETSRKTRGSWSTGSWWKGSKRYKLSMPWNVFNNSFLLENWYSLQ